MLLDNARSAMDMLNYGWCLLERSGSEGRKAPVYIIREANGIFCDIMGADNAICGETIQAVCPSIFTTIQPDLANESGIADASHHAEATFNNRYFDIHVSEFDGPQSGHYALVLSGIRASKRVTKYVPSIREPLYPSLDIGLAGAFYWEVQRNRVILDENIKYYLSLPDRVLTDGLPLRDVLPAILPEDRQGVYRSLMKAVNGAENYQTEFRIHAPNGGIRWISARATVKRDDSGTPVELIGFAMDITERKVAEKALQKSEAMLMTESNTMRGLYDSGNRLMAITDLNTALAEILDSSIALLGADFGNIQLYNTLNDKLELIVHRGFDNEFADIFQFVDCGDHTACGRAIASGKRVIIEDVELDGPFAPYVAEAKKSGFRAVQSTPLFDNKGNLLAVLSTHFRLPHRPSDTELLKLDLYVRQAIDFIARVHNEGALAKSEESYRAIVNQSIAGILKVDFTGRVTFSNEKLAEMLGYDLSEMAQQTVADIVHPDDIARNGILFERLVNEGEAYSIEKRMLRKDGSFIWVNNQVSPLFDGKGEPQAAVIVSVDITEQKAIDRLKDEFISTASHELKTPLTGIKAYGQIISRHLEAENTPASRVVSRLNRQVDRMVKLVYMLLDTGLVSGGKLALQKETFDMNALIGECLAEIRLSGLKHDLHFVPCDLPLVTADRDRIGQVLANLIVNAFKYSPDGSRVTVACQSDGLTIKISVRDDGIGVAVENQHRIFERFYRAGDSGEASPSGFGLGLFIAAQIINEHQGEIGVESNIGHGSLFHFTLPLDKDSA
ncbi:PAS domain-containing protein [Parapedobacter sp. 10938]|uniref:PAS domain-containing protein n=1 Tax=Parapedobacter flavus TaxID=3110225 RepID=UPI002DBA550C|nr:PAS domain-containing protein [Parapedobacter sp. 10938]MEC3879583.1 PAS domain-containing protein [Parapedobacter sp. 10938]